MWSDTVAMYQFAPPILSYLCKCRDGQVLQRITLKMNSLLVLSIRYSFLANHRITKNSQLDIQNSSTLQNSYFLILTII